MPGPFPGMDPYLERVGYWQEFHNSLIYLLKRAINETLPERFVARSEARVYIDSTPPLRPIPDVSVFAVGRRASSPTRGGAATTATPIQRTTPPEEILLEERREAYIEILDRANGKQVVMVIEALSPENKTGAGRGEYQRKQTALLRSQVHLLEIDLLRGGLHTVAAPEEGARALGAYAYLISLVNAHCPGSVFVWRIGLREALPILKLPLTPDAAPFDLDLQHVFDQCYDEGRYAVLLEDLYAGPAEPPLSSEEALWARSLLDASST